MFRATVVTLGKRITLTAVVGLLAFILGARDAQAQRVQRAGVPISGASPGFFPYYRVAPGLNLRQAAYNTALMGRAYSQFPAWAAGYAQPYALGFSPYGNPGVAYPGTAQAVANSALFNPNLAYLATGYRGPYVTPYYVSPYLYANPYVSYANPYAGYANPYLASNPYAAYGNPYLATNPYVYDYGLGGP